MDPRIGKAFDFAADITKQLITLATAVIGAVITFGDHALVVKAGGPLVFAIAGYGFSAIAGALTLMALTGRLGSPKITLAQCTPYATNVRLLSASQVILFLLATGIFAWATVRAIM